MIRVALAEVGGVVWIYTRRRLLCPICAETKGCGGGRRVDARGRAEAGTPARAEDKPSLCCKAGETCDKQTAVAEGLGKCRKANHSKTPGTRNMSMIGQHDEAERHPSAGGERSIE